MAAPSGAETSVALILIPSPGQDFQVLLISRAANPQDPWSGHVALPGGRRDRQDADRTATAIRETREETGIALRRKDLVGELDDLYPRTPTYPELAVRPFVFGLAAKPPTIPGPEVRACFWVSLGALPRAAGTAALPIAGTRTLVPAYRIGSRTVWGITYRILADLLEVLRG